MPRTSELTDRITELLGRQDEISPDELEEIATYKSDERITPFDNFNIGMVFNGRKRYVDALRCFDDALDAYKTPEEKKLIPYTHVQIGEVLHRCGTQTLCKKNPIEAMKLYSQSSRAYAKALGNVEFLPIELLPVILCNAAAVFYNVGAYHDVIQICVTYQVFQSDLSDCVTELTDGAIDIMLKLAAEKVNAVGN